MSLSWNNITVKLGDLKPWADNPKFTTKAQAQRLLDSFKEFGQVQTVAVGPNLEVYDGHQRLSALLTIHGADYELAARQSNRELTDEERRKLVITLHAGAVGSWDWNMLSGWDAPQMMEWGLDTNTLKDWKRDTTALSMMIEAEDAEVMLPDESPLFYRVPDAVWGSNNDFGIPLLDLNMQATCFETPFVSWGTVSRKSKMTGTWNFYVDDYRFERLWREPLDIVNSGCRAIVEPNFSVYDDMPVAVALWQIYRKRWIARWVQSCGIRVIVDLNTSWRHEHLRFLGVPEGWKSYCTRGYSERLDDIVKEYEVAVKHAGTDSVLFIVYGGGKQAEGLSKQRGWIWYQDQQTKDARSKDNG